MFGVTTHRQLGKVNKVLKKKKVLWISQEQDARKQEYSKSSSIRQTFDASTDTAEESSEPVTGAEHDSLANTIQ